MSDKRATADLAIARLADRQYGIVSTGQLIAAGLDKDRILHRVRTGRLRRIHQGVYALGHGALSSEARMMAAVLACGRSGHRGGGSVLAHWGAAISHLSAACLWGILGPSEGHVDIVVAGGGGRRARRGVRVHRSRSLAPADVTLRRGIPVTTPARTIADLRRSVWVPGGQGLISPKELRRAIRQADVLGLPLGDGEDCDHTRSDLELDFLDLCRRHRLPAPEVNVRVGRHLVDFLWRARRVAVETDSYLYHRGREAFQDDRARDLDLRALGLQVVRLSEKQVNEEAPQVASALRRALRVGADVTGSTRRS